MILEKEKQKEKPKTIAQERKDTMGREGIDIDLELKKLEQEVKNESESVGADLSTQKQGLKAETLAKDQTALGSEAALTLPDWVKYPWMYTRPAKPEYLDSWLKDWCDLVLKWCQFTVRHVVGLKDFKSSKPFDKLPEKELRDIVQYIVNRGLGKWIDKDKTVARIMWRSLEEWVNEMYEWAYNNGVEMLDMFSAKSANRDFSSLPVSDIRSVMELMAKNKMIKWVDKKHEQAKLIFQ
jgi:hypothetical protein